MLSQKCTFTVLLIFLNGFRTPHVRDTAAWELLLPKALLSRDRGTRQAARACHWPALSSDSERFLFTLKCKPGRHFSPYRCFSLWYSSRYQTCHWLPLILFTVMLLISGGLKQSDFGYCLVLFCAWERPVLHLYLMSAARNTYTFTAFVLSLCVLYLRLLSTHVFNVSSAHGYLCIFFLVRCLKH